MAVERQSLEPAYVLHVQPYRESSCLVNLITREHGRIALVARGVRRAGSSTRMLLQPFSPLLVSWSARGELGTLGKVERASPLSPLAGPALMSGLYINELLMRLTHRFDAHPELFDSYDRLLRQLAGRREVSGRPIEAVLRHFEKRLLEDLGYGLLLEHDARSGDPVQPDAWYSYRVQLGPVLQSEGNAAAQPGGVTVRGSALLALAADGPLDDDARVQIKRLMRAEIDSHLGRRPLVSRSLFRPRGGAGNGVTGTGDGRRPEVGLEE